MNISVIVITKNEESMIRDCLDSVKWADEVIVVDDMSTDRTAEICQGYSNVKVFEREWDGFGPQKNYALTIASGDWILSLDADERVPEDLEKEILRKIKEDKYDGYRIKLKHLVFGKWVSDYKPLNLRLFKKTKASFTKEKVHESVILDGDAGWLDGQIVHYSRSYSDIRSYMDIYVRKYSSYTAEDLYKKGRRVTWKNCLDYYFLRPVFIFFQKYFQKNGYKEGWRGFVVSILASCSYFMSYFKLWELQREEKRYRK